MNLKIYFKDKPLFLCEELTPEITEYMHHDDAVFIDEFSLPGIKSMLHEMKESKIHAGIFQHTPLEELKKAIWKKFNVIKAGGGLVFNDKNEILLMYRRGKWDLPKGKLDKGETIEECAIRETIEETGLKDVTIIAPLPTTYHTYEENGKAFLKESYWYTMKAKGKQELVPQEAEQITAVEWVPVKQLKTYIDNTYPSVLDVLRAGGLIQDA